MDDLADRCLVAAAMCILHAHPVTLSCGPRSGNCSPHKELDERAAVAKLTASSRGPVARSGQSAFAPPILGARGMALAPPAMPLPPGLLFSSLTSGPESPMALDRHRRC
jgi:hypothetical protein